MHTVRLPRVDSECVKARGGLVKAVAAWCTLMVVMAKMCKCVVFSFSFLSGLLQLYTVYVDGNQNKYTNKTWTLAFDRNRFKPGSSVKSPRTLPSKKIVSYV